MDKPTHPPYNALHRPPDSAKKPHATPRIRADEMRIFISRWSSVGSKLSDTITAAIKAKVFVKASGLKSLPSAPRIKKMGKKLITVVSTAVNTAPATSRTARKTTSMRSSSALAFCN